MIRNLSSILAAVMGDAFNIYSTGDIISCIDEIDVIDVDYEDVTEDTTNPTDTTKLIDQ